MQPIQKTGTESSTRLTPESPAQAAIAQYDTPQVYVIGRSKDLLQGSGRHKNDDTGSRGFSVDQR
jgi:hypothetical protein